MLLGRADSLSPSRSRAGSGESGGLTICKAASESRKADLYPQASTGEKKENFSHHRVRKL